MASNAAKRSAQAYRFAAALIVAVTVSGCASRAEKAAREAAAFGPVCAGMGAALGTAEHRACVLRLMEIAASERRSIIGAGSAPAYDPQAEYRARQERIEDAYRQTQMQNSLRKIERDMRRQSLGRAMPPGPVRDGYCSAGGC